MPRIAVTEENLKKQIAALDLKIRALKKKLRVIRMKTTLSSKRQLAKSVRANQSEVLEALKKKAPQLYKKLMTGPVKKRKYTRRKKA